MTNPAEKFSNTPRLGQGPYWQELAAGMAFKTFRRSISEADLVGFIAVTGMLEEMFIDASDATSSLGMRPVPGALTFTLIEGLQLQSLVQGTGLAFLELNLMAVAPVRVGDTIWAGIEITDVKPTSRGGRAVVTSRVEVFKGDDDLVMTYVIKRLVAGAPAS